MGTAAILCNVVLFVITGIIILTAGMPGDARYLVLASLVLLVPLFSAVVLVRERIAPQGPTTHDDVLPTIRFTNRVAVLCNLVLVGASARRGTSGSSNCQMKAMHSGCRSVMSSNQSANWRCT